MGRKKKIALLCLVIVSVVVLAIFIPTYLQSYYDPGNTDTPVFSLPIKQANYANVSGVQRFHSPDHVGLDFQLRNATEIIAPIGGKIVGIEHHMMSNNLWIVDVTLRINPAWGMYIAFEPDTNDEAVTIAQQANISTYIKVGDIVDVNQTLGWLLPVPASEFPHIHWTVYRIGFWGELFTEGNENVNPWIYLDTWARVIVDGYCSSFHDFTPC